jgi:hypothetical protein
MPQKYIITKTVGLPSHGLEKSIHNISGGEISNLETFSKLYTLISYRGLARDVINDVADGRRHVGGIFLRRTGRFNGNNVRKRPKIGHFSGPNPGRNVPMHQIKPELRCQDLEGINLPSFRFSWKLKKLCRVDFFVFESWQTAVKSQGKTIT